MYTIKSLLAKAQQVPKYLAFAGMLYSTVLPATLAMQSNASVFASKPALLAIADMHLASLPAETEKNSQMTMIQGSALFSQMSADDNKCDAKEIKKTLAKSKAEVKTTPVLTSKIDSLKKVIVTAYSSTVDQTDSTPFITAKGTMVRDGIIACNFLQFGTKVRLPEIFGDKVFVVEDRMAKKNSHKMDVWMPDRQTALTFGVKTLAYEIVE